MSLRFGIGAKRIGVDARDKLCPMTAANQFGREAAGRRRIAGFGATGERIDDFDERCVGGR